MARKRKPRTTQATTGLPATYIEAEEMYIIEILLRWRPRYEELISSEESHKLFQADFLRRLQTGAGTLDAATIVKFAQHGHGPADHAVREYVQIRSEDHRLDEMPTSVINYLREVIMVRGPLPVGYPSTCWQGLNNFKRDILITKLINTIHARWPAVPPLYSTGQRRSAAALVGKCLDLGEAQVRRIYKARREIAQQFIEFMDSYRLAPL
jgi:hypothetical protein